jgi:CBS domain-containing protein
MEPQENPGRSVMFDTSNLTAADVMTRNVITIGPKATLRQAARLMLDRAVSALPVVDTEGRVLGVVSEAELIRPDEVAENRARRWLDILAEGEELSPEFLAMVNGIDRPVSKVMRTDFIRVSEHTPLREVAALICRRFTRRVLVMRDDKLVGLVARRDLVRVLAGDVLAGQKCR